MFFRSVKLGLALGLYFLFVLFCFNWEVDKIVSVFAYRPLYLFIGSLIALAIFEKQASRFWNWLNERHIGWWIGVCAGTTFSLSLYYAYGPLEAVPHAFDDLCYLWMSHTFAMGRIWMESHDLPEFFQQVFFVNDGKWYPLFQPGWPLFLVLGVLTGLEYAVSPMLVALSVVLCYFIGKRVFNDRIARLAMLLMSVSQMLLIFGGLIFTHPFSLVLTEVAVLLTLRLSERDSLKDSLLLGVALGWLFITRALNLVSLLPVVSLPLIVFMLRGRIRFRNLALGALVALVFLVGQLAYNHELTGDALTWPQNHYFSLTEKDANCHDLGFGPHIGCQNLHGAEGFPNGFYPSDIPGVFHRRMAQFLLSIFGWQALFLFFGIPFFLSRSGWKKYILLSVFLSLIVGYSFFYFHGARGRYYIESCFALFILVSAGAYQLRERLEPLSKRPGGLNVVFGRLLRGFAPAMCVAYMLFNVLFFIPATEDVLHNFYGVDRRYERITAGLPDKSIIFVKHDYRATFMYMTPGLPETRLFVQDLGKQNRQIMQYYPDWHFYRYNSDTKQLETLEPDTDPGEVFMEAEFKFITDDRSGEYLHPDLVTEGEKASGDMILVFDAKGEGSFAAIKQYIFADGAYDIEIRFATGPNRGEYQVSVDGRACGAPVDLYAAKAGFLSWCPETGLPVDLKKGQHRFAFEVVGRNAASSGYTLGVDWIELKTYQLRSND